MLGSILSAAIKTVALPVKVAASALDQVTGGDGSKESRTDGHNPFGDLEKLSDNAAEAAEEIDQ